jgi:hypothetical protein
MYNYSRIYTSWVTYKLNGDKLKGWLINKEVELIKLLKLYEKEKDYNQLCLT